MGVKKCVSRSASWRPIFRDIYRSKKRPIGNCGVFPFLKISSPAKGWESYFLVWFVWKRMQTETRVAHKLTAECSLPTGSRITWRLSGSIPISNSFIWGCHIVEVLFVVTPDQPISSEMFQQDLLLVAIIGKRGVARFISITIATSHGWLRCWCKTIAWTISTSGPQTNPLQTPSNSTLRPDLGDSSLFSLCSNNHWATPSTAYGICARMTRWSTISISLQPS